MPLLFMMWLELIILGDFHLIMGFQKEKAQQRMELGGVDLGKNSFKE